MPEHSVNTGGAPISQREGNINTEGETQRMWNSAEGTLAKGMCGHITKFPEFNTEAIYMYGIFIQCRTWILSSVLWILNNFL